MSNPTYQPARRGVTVAELLGWIAAVIPGILCVLAVGMALLPSLFLGMTNYNVISNMEFVGMANYSRLMQDKVFLIALSNSLVDLLVIGVGGFVLCLLIALLLRRLPQVVRYIPVAALFAPLLCPGLVQMLNVLFSGDAYGLVNSLLINAEIIEEPIFFLMSEKYLPIIVRLTQLWRSLGPGVLIISAGLDSVRPATLSEAGRRGMTSHFSVFLQITLPRMRVPLMLAAATMVMAAMGTSTVSKGLAGTSSVGYCAHTLWVHVWNYGFVRFNLGYGAAITTVTQAIEILTILLLCAMIFLLTWRPCRARYAKFPAPPVLPGLSDKWDTWRILWTVAGAVVTLLICVVPVFMLTMEFNMSLKPRDELFAYPPRLLVQEPTLSNFEDLFVTIGDSSVSLFLQIPRALLFMMLPMLLTTVIAAVVGYGLSRRRSRPVRVLLAAILLLLLISSPFMGLLHTWYSRERIPTVGDALRWVLWAFMPVCAMLGLSVGEMCRRKWPVLRVLAVAAAYVSLVLFFCWQGTMGEIANQIGAGGIARSGQTAAAFVIQDMAGLLLGIPIIAGLFQMLIGLGNTYPLYRGGNE